jgi:hypothetical protein
MRRPLNNLIAVMLLIIMSAVWNQNATGSDAPKNMGPSETAKRHIAREREFLYRAVDELNRSQGYVLDTMRLSEKMIYAAYLIEPSGKERDRRTFREWYQAYEELFRNNAADFEADLSRAYSDKAGDSIKPDQYDLLIDGCTRMGSQLEEQVSHFEKISTATEDRIRGLRQALEYFSSPAFLEKMRRNEKPPQPEGDRHTEDKNSNKKPSQTESDRHSKELYDRHKDITDAEIAMMHIELKNLEEIERHYGAFIEMGRMELFWISRKGGDYEALSRLAGAIGSNAPVSIEEASNRLIKIYESDITYFKKKIDDLSRAQDRLVPTGTMRTLDLREALSENYDQMKNRYDHHITWLAEQVGAYRADIIMLEKDK